MASINFFFEGDAKIVSLKKTQTRSWIENMVAQYEFTITCINYIFCRDAYLHEINVKYLNHDTYTDIITFDNSQSKEDLEGDIFISIDRVRENALTFEKDFTEELHRVIAHGTLHLLGYKDKSALEKKTMRDEEERWLKFNKVPRGTYSIHVPRGTSKN